MGDVTGRMVDIKRLQVGESMMGIEVQCEQADFLCHRCHARQRRDYPSIWPKLTPPAQDLHPVNSAALASSLRFVGSNTLDLLVAHRTPRRNWKIRICSCHVISSGIAWLFIYSGACWPLCTVPRCCREFVSQSRRGLTGADAAQCPAVVAMSVRNRVVIWPAQERRDGDRIRLTLAR